MSEKTAQQKEELTPIIKDLAERLDRAYYNGESLVPVVFTTDEVQSLLKYLPEVA